MSRNGESKIENYVLEIEDLPPHVHSRKSLHEYLDSVLEEIRDGMGEGKDGRSMELKITYHPMTKAEIEALPSI